MTFKILEATDKAIDRVIDRVIDRTIDIIIIKITDKTINKVINEKTIGFIIANKVIEAINKQDLEILGRILGISLGFIKEKALKLKKLIY